MDKQTQSAKKPKYLFTRTYPVVIERDEGGYFATCPTLQGCSTQGETYEATLANIREAD